MGAGLAEPQRQVATYEAELKCPGFLAAGAFSVTTAHAAATVVPREWCWRGAPISPPAGSICSSGACPKLVARVSRVPIWEMHSIEPTGRGMKAMKSSRFWTAAALLAVYAGGASANDELIKLSKDPNQWVMPTGNYANWRYSELNQSNKDNVKNLRPLWTFSTGVLRGHEGGPLVIGDIMYIHTPFPNNVFALDLSRNGQILWKY